MKLSKQEQHDKDIQRICDILRPAACARATCADKLKNDFSMQNPPTHA